MGCDADIVVVACGEGVLCLVYAAPCLLGFGVVTDRLGEGLRDLPLHLHRYFYTEEGGVWLPRRVSALPHDLDQASAHSVEDFGDGLRRHLGLEYVDEGVVGGLRLLHLH